MGPRRSGEFDISFDFGTWHSRHRAATLGKALADAPPPPPRRALTKGIPIANPTKKPPVFSIRDPVPSTPSSSSLVAARVEDNFNGALHCVKAFSIATFMVGVGATATVFGVRQYMGVQTTQEFADRMRHAVLTRMPILSARIHRPPEAQDGDSLLPHDPPPLSLEDAAEEWTWPAAEQRLREAFDKDGFYGWAAAVMRS
uniref:Calcium-transporting ATPase (EC) n=1 Tax=Ganoderma boninense TaxID=34458 RepID=A0A5K1K1S6_9APHY|nr:Calcium-transporting ATPase (EC [Ganoderma boninense]